MGTPRQHLTIAAFCEEFQVARSTFYEQQHDKPHSYDLRKHE
jgi:hypothetical protein